MPGLGADTEFQIPTGYSPPLAIVTEDDHTAWIMVASALGLACTLLFGGIRVFVRSTICPGIGMDDIFLAGATVLAIFQTSVILSASLNGLGKSTELVPSGKHAKVQQLYYSGILLFITALGLSKLSVIFFLLRLTPFGTHKRVFYTVAGCTIAWTVGSLFAAALQCNLAHPWVVMGEQCSGAFVRWQIICAIDIIIEICIVGMSTLLVFKIQASLSTKLAVVATFSPRLLMIIPISMRLAEFKEAGRSSNFTLLDDLFIVWTQTELNYSLISATIPTLRSFISKLNTQFGGLGEGEGEGAYGNGYSKGSSKKSSKLNDSFQMSNLSSVKTQKDTQKVGKPSTFKGNLLESPEIYEYNIQTSSTVPDWSISKASSRGSPSGQNLMAVDARSVDSNDSQQLMIRKEIMYTVERQHAS